MSITRIFSFVLLLVLPMKMSLADVSGLPRIIDGDTIEVAGERIRLHGIDFLLRNCYEICYDLHALSALKGAENGAKTAFPRWVRIP